jgi:hypothetical protein
MPKPDLLYICLNDGSDTRINKEVTTLAAAFNVHYVGIGRGTERSFAAGQCRTFTLVRGHHKQPFTFLRFWLRVAGRLLGRRFDSVHVINEQLVLLFYPFLYPVRRRVVLDVFDSIFLRMRRQVAWLARLVYALPRVLIVTDANRHGLLPAPFQSKAVVVENYPYRFGGHGPKTGGAGELTIFYNGSMSLSRGTALLQGLLEARPGVRVKMAGWVYDEPTRQLSRHPGVEFLGVITQQQSMQVAAGCDYILSLYEPINENNINASPNKIYDAIQAGTPVIINQEVKIATFVARQRLGYVLPSFYQTDHAHLADELLRLKHTFVFAPDLRSRYTWEAVAGKLLAAHRR